MRLLSKRAHWLVAYTRDPSAEADTASPVVLINWLMVEEQKESTEPLP